ncbi:hypothetical protein FH972_026588 [Carpinus fangiana]|uniref:NECAP PHear domain-containing protein n=1 Tax=Carpinus fangiana TaxID=176857 RepID=A0A5N6L4T9_9ROSI|nr:hypothetical protein FH972_026588 [Carpinus fangiana]
MTTVDPSTNRPLPADAIQRVLHITSKVHIYGPLPPLMGKGYNAAAWTTGSPIFSGRMRVLETAIPTPPSGEKVSVAIILEDSSTGELFAAAPYTHPTSVLQALDSSRAFALRVVGEGGMKATLGMFFEERSEAFDFGVALQDAAKTLNFADTKGGPSRKSAMEQKKEAEKKDYSLKDGETITVNIGGRSARKSVSSEGSNTGATPFLPPPPSASEVKKQMEKDAAHQPTAEELGFDDGEFGEFQ